jgi:hypothetical protein
MPKGSSRADSRHKEFQFSVRSETPGGPSADEIYAILTKHEQSLLVVETEEEPDPQVQAEDKVSPDVIGTIPSPAPDNDGDEGPGEEAEEEPKSPYEPVAFEVLNLLAPWGEIENEDDAFFSQNRLRNTVERELPNHGMSTAPGRIDAAINYLREEEYITPVAGRRRQYVVTKKALFFMHTYQLPEGHDEQKYAGLLASRSGLAFSLLSHMEGKMREFALETQTALERQRDLNAKKKQLEGEIASLGTQLADVEQELRLEEEATELRLAKYMPYLQTKIEDEAAMAA